MSDNRPANYFNDSAKSPQERYYAYKLRTEKLAAISASGIAGGTPWLTTEEATALGSIGEKEKLEVKILARLYSLADSSPEYLQVRALTDTKDREEAAKSLADIYYRKFTTEMVLNKFVAPETATTRILQPAIAASRTAYDAFGTNN